MPQSPRSAVTARIVALVAAITLSASLAACSPAGDDDGPSQDASGPSRDSSPSPDASDPGEESPGPAPSSGGAPSGGTALDVTCLDLVPLETMYEFDPNFGLDDGYSPESGSLAATAESASGIACGWVQQTSGEVIEIAASRPSADALADLRADAGSDRAFSMAGDRSVVQVFTGETWVVASSSYFTTADDAAPLVDSVVAALG